jgi:hypothetical protein
MDFMNSTESQNNQNELEIESQNLFYFNATSTNLIKKKLNESKNKTKTKVYNDTLNSEGVSLIKTLYSDGVYYNDTIISHNFTKKHNLTKIKKHHSHHHHKNITIVPNTTSEFIIVKSVNKTSNLQLERSKTNNTITDPTQISEDMLKASTFSLLTYDISIIGEVVLYYMAILFLLLTYCIIIKILINKCYEYFVFHNYKLNARNYSYLFLNITVCLIINVVLGIILYSDMLMILLFAVDSQLIAAAITFHFQHGKVFGPLGFSMFGILISIRLVNVGSILVKFLLIFVIALVFFFIGALVGVNKYIEYDKVKNTERMRRPIQRMTTMTEESILTK